MSEPANLRFQISNLRTAIFRKPKTSGEAETIGTMSNHPFWSEDRQEFVQAGSLEIGERLQTLSGDVKVVQQKLPRPGPQPVFNLEVHDEHVCFVGEDGVLVHNAYTKGQRPGGYKVGDVDQHSRLSLGPNRASGNMHSIDDGLVESHHFIQDEWAKQNTHLFTEGTYSRSKAAAILLESTSGSAHAQVAAMQRQLRSSSGYATSIGFEFQ